MAIKAASGRRRKTAMPIREIADAELAHGRHVLLQGIMEMAQ